MVVKAEKSYVCILHHQLLPVSMCGAREGSTDSAGMGESYGTAQLCAVSPDAAPMCTGLCSALLSVPGRVPPAPATMAVKPLQG